MSSSFSRHSLKEIVGKLIVGQFAAALFLLSASFGHCLDRGLETASEYRGLPVVTDSRIAVRFYAVTGETAPQIREALNRLGPVDQMGRRGDAYTSWHVTWRWPTDKDGKANLSQASCAVTVETMLPTVTTLNRLTTSLREEWRAFAKALGDHEYQHALHGLIHGPKICEEIRHRAQLEPEGFTAEMAQTLAREAIVKIRALDQRYDRDTLHGRTEGVRFPRIGTQTQERNGPTGSP